MGLLQSGPLLRSPGLQDQSGSPLAPDSAYIQTTQNREIDWYISELRRGMRLEGQLRESAVGKALSAQARRLQCDPQNLHKNAGCVGAHVRCKFQAIQGPCFKSGYSREMAPEADLWSPYVRTHTHICSCPPTCLCGSPSSHQGQPSRPQMCSQLWPLVPLFIQ